MSTSNEELPVPHDVAPSDLPVPPAVVEIGEPHEALAKVSARYIWLQVLAQFGVFVAFITPLARLCITASRRESGRDGTVTGASRSRHTAATPAPTRVPCSSLNQQFERG